MLRNKALSVLQKTYDDSYLSCSTAVYHESQGNESEAMRHWRCSLDQIYDFNSKYLSSNYPAQNDTEKALREALKQLELQCKERIDLLEALRISRQENQDSPATSRSRRVSSATDGDGRTKGSIGQGTVPAITYSELSRPALPPRPAPPRRFSSETPPPESKHPSLAPESSRTHSARSSSPAVGGVPSRTMRPHSPEKHTMRTTLRVGKPGKLVRKSEKPVGEGPSKAATLAWSALGSRDRLRETNSEAGPASSNGLSRPSLDQHRAQSQAQLQWDSHSRRLVPPREDSPASMRHSDEYPYRGPSQLSVSAASSALNTQAQPELPPTGQVTRSLDLDPGRQAAISTMFTPRKSSRQDVYQESGVVAASVAAAERPSPSGTPSSGGIPRRRVGRDSKTDQERSARPRQTRPKPRRSSSSSISEGQDTAHHTNQSRTKERPSSTQAASQPEGDSEVEEPPSETTIWKRKKAAILKSLPPGVDESAAKQILNDIVVQGDEVHWGDVAGLEIAKTALREAVVYPFLRPDLFMGLREPARGMLLFGPPGTGKTMLARAVATESKSTFFSISASSLTSKYLGESEKLVRALFGLAKLLAPSIIFVDEIDSLLSQRSGSGEHEATRRIKTEFLIQWSELQRAAAGRETTDKDRERGDVNRVLVLAATNLPWAIDEAARRRFVRRQYIPLPEATTRETQLRTLLAQQKHDLSADDLQRLVKLTDGFSGSDITALAKDAAMGPLRSLGEALLHMTMEDIRPIKLIDFEASLTTIRPSVSKAGLKEHEDWAREFGERGG